jgi:hypothetical protein
MNALTAARGESLSGFQTAVERGAQRLWRIATKSRGILRPAPLAKGHSPNDPEYRAALLEGL